VWKPHIDEPCYTIKVVSERLTIHPQTIRNYEKTGLLKPSRTEGNVRLFSERDMGKLNKIMTFREMGVNLAGIEIIIKLLEQVEELKAIIQEKQSDSI